MKKNNLCPCKSNKNYSDCCEKYHKGSFPENALALMRSRYSGYALGLANYIMETSHPLNSKYGKDPIEWAAQIMEFSNSITFEDLEILDFTDGKETAYVTFKAILKQGLKDVSYVEKSRFFKVNGRWLYVDGVISV